jgi:hypothetical protein
MLFPAYYVAVMFGGALVSKALSPSVVIALGLSVVYPDETKASFLMLFYGAALLISAFRD